MAESTISIKVVTTVGNSVRDLNRVASAVSLVAQATGSCGGNVQDLASQFNGVSQTSRATTRSVKEVTKETKKAGKEADKSSGFFGKLVRSFGRIAFYRSIRKILSETVKAFKEGISNAYAYSQAMNGLDSTNLSGNIDRITSSVNYFKNALGASLTPVIQALTPVVENLIDALARLGNKISEVLGSVFGNSNYTYAVKVGTQEEDSLKRAVGYAKELKRTLLGFDEINRLDAPDNGSGGGSTDNNLAGYKFAEGSISEVGDKIADVLQAIAVLSGLPLAGLGLILMFSGFIPAGIDLVIAGLGLSALPFVINGGTIPDDVQDVLNSIQAIAMGVGIGLGIILMLTGNVPVGLALVGAGVVALVTGVIPNWDDLPDKVQSTLGWIATIVGGFSAIVGLLMLLGAPSLALKGLGLGLLVAGIGAFGWGTSTTGAIDWDSLLTSLKATWDKIVTWFNEKVAPKFTKKYWQEKFDSIRQGIADKVLGFDARWDKVKDWWKENVAPKFTKKWWSDKFECIRNGIVNKVLGFGERWKQVKEWWKENVAPKFKKEWWKNKFDTIKNGLAESNVVKKIKEVWSSITSWYDEKVAPIFTKDFWTKKWNNIKSTFTNIMDSFAQVIIDGLASVEQFINTALKVIKNNLAKVDEVAGTDFASKIKYLDTFTNASASDYRKKTGRYATGIQERASGGLVSSGQLYIARENGISEFIGSFGNQTGVANNEQIVDGIKRGVYEAMTMANGGSQNIAISVDGKELFNVMVNQNNSTVRRTGSSPLLV